MDRSPDLDLEPLLETPFESVSNRPFHALLAAGIVLLGVVAILGRNPVTAAAVVCYLVAIPVYVGLRARREDGGRERRAREDDAAEGERDGGETDGDGVDGETDGDGTADEES